MAGATGGAVSASSDTEARLARIEEQLTRLTQLAAPAPAVESTSKPTGKSSRK
jgi:hypothetical protein